MSEEVKGGSVPHGVLLESMEGPRGLFCILPIIPWWVLRYIYMVHGADSDFVLPCYSAGDNTSDQSAFGIPAVKKEGGVKNGYRTEQKFLLSYLDDQSGSSSP